MSNLLDYYLKTEGAAARLDHFIDTLPCELHEQARAELPDKAVDAYLYRGGNHDER